MLTPEQRSERSRKAAETRRANKIAAAARQRQEEENSEKNWNWLPLILAAVLLIGLILWHPWTTSKAALTAVPTKALTAAPTKAPVVQPTKAPVVAQPTQAPVLTTKAPALVIPTEAPTKTSVVIATKTPIVVILPTNPSLEGKLGTVTQQGEDLDTILGKRITFTCRKIVVRTKFWNEVLSPEELKSVETTWVDFTISVPEGMFARIFAGGIRQGTNTYNEGVLMNLKPGTYEFSLRNGEIVLWYPEQDKFEQNDLVRIFDQIRNGNFDIHSELAFFATTTDLLPKIPADLVQKNNVQIIPSLNPTLK